MEYDNTNTGAIFVNDKKSTDKHPDRKGSLNVGGVEYWLSGWLKKDKSGNTYMSLSVTPKEAQQAKHAQSNKQAPERFIDDDLSGVPF